MPAGRLLFAKRRLWSPYDIPRSVLRAWWNADDHASSVLMTDDGAGLISSWSDRINGLPVTAAAGARPTWTDNSFNGSTKAAVIFDATANALVTTTLTNLPTAAVAGTLWGVAQTTSAAPAATRYIAAIGANSVYRAIGQTITTGTLIFDNGTVGVNSAAAWAANAPAIIEGVFDGNITGYWNGTSQGAIAETLNTTATRFRIGASSNTGGNKFFGGGIRHVLITTDLTTLQRQQLEGWLAWDSGLTSLLPSSHPYKLVPP